MGDVVTASSFSQASASSAPSSTIQITVVGEKGTKANCKLYRNEKLSDILKKYNHRIHTQYDGIMINGAPVQLFKTPAQLGLLDGHILQFYRTPSAAAPVAATSNAVVTTTVSSSIPTVVATVVSSLSSSSASSSSSSSSSSSFTTPAEATAEISRLQQRVMTLEADFANKKIALEDKVMAVEARLSEEQEKTQCRICFERDRDTVIFPCLHFNYCSKCLEELSHRSHECPSCRSHISGTLKLQIQIGS